MKNLLWAMVILTTLTSLFSVSAIIDENGWYLLLALITGVLLLFFWIRAEEVYDAAVAAKMSDKTIKELSTTFFRHWWNAPGNNTEQGFDAWWKKNKTKYKNDEK